ncbi:MAG: CoA transferase subunit A [Vulcanimicrobiaceae bacterium]
MNKVFSDVAAAVAGIPIGASIAVGGFGLNGVPIKLIDALLEQGAHDLSIVSNNCGTDGFGLGRLLEANKIRRMTSSYVGENREFERQYLNGDLELELVPQGTLAERLRAGGAGIPAFYTPAGVGTVIADGGMPWRFHYDGTTAVSSPRKETRVFDVFDHERPYVLETAIVTEYAFVRASKGDRHGNLIYDKATRNFNPLCAAAGEITIAEVEELVEPGEIDPQDVHTPGIFVQRIVVVGKADKRIERVTVRKREPAAVAANGAAAHS